ncbi:MAG: cytidine/deoxycytidylate deaminase family protein [Coriobacteriales bacterium]|nr:cytidine/deoxycytidylate deaminase family protein [Coriobacteriales bacterium]
MDSSKTIAERPSWDEYFLTITRDVADRSTCIRRHVGAIIVKDKRILATGYNNVPSGIAHCTERGCLRDELGIPSGQKHELCRGLHAEQNAVIQAAKHGVSIDGSIVYCTNQPCVVCAKILINAGVTEIIYENPYPDALAEEMLAEAGVKLRCIGGE